tara:strand:+ start:77 stop:703 length:627 start_codon:yes stop_codon:yes gene_type:complete
MGIKYKLKLKDLKFEFLKEYFSPLLKYLRPRRKISSYQDLKDFVQRKSAWVSQETLYGYLKTRMGAKYVLMFEDEIFLSSINRAKWNIYVVALQDLSFYSISYLKDIYNLHDISKAKEIYFEILNDEKKNGIPEDIFKQASDKFENRNLKIDWENYYKSLPFNSSALALYEWSPIAEELKTLDKKIVLNSMILKWDNIKKEFNELISF